MMVNMYCVEHVNIQAAALAIAANSYRMPVRIS